MRSNAMDRADKALNKALKMIVFIVYFIFAWIVVLNAELSLIADTCNQAMSDSFKGIVFSVIIWVVLVALNLKSKSNFNFWISVLIPSCYFIAVLPRSFAIFSHVVIKHKNFCTIEMMVESRVDVFDLIGGICWLLLSLAAICFLGFSSWRFFYWLKYQYIKQKN